MNSNFKNVILLLCAGTITVFTVGGCNTSKGLGKDVEKLGDKIQDKASR